MDKVTVVARATKRILEVIFKENKTTVVLFLSKFIRKLVDGLEDTSSIDLGNGKLKQRRIYNLYCSENIYVGINK